MKGLKGKRIIVAGGATGIGAFTAARLAAEGARIVIGDINMKGLEATMAKIKGDGGDTIGMSCDISDATAVNGFVARAVAHLGGLDGVAIAAAATGDTIANDRELMHMDMAIWDRTLKVNLVGHALMMQAAIPHLVRTGGGAIVTISSAAATAGNAALPAYAASKAGLNALVRHVARLCGKDKIRCNAIAPGLVLIPDHPNITPAMIEQRLKDIALTRLGQGEDPAAAIAFLLSDDSSWITGQVIAVNGGAQFRD